MCLERSAVVVTQFLTAAVSAMINGWNKRLYDSPIAWQ